MMILSFALQFFMMICRQKCGKMIMLACCWTVRVRFHSSMEWMGLFSLYAIWLEGKQSADWPSSECNVNFSATEWPFSLGGKQKKTSLGGRQATNRMGHKGAFHPHCWAKAKADPSAISKLHMIWPFHLVLSHMNKSSKNG